MDGGNPLDQRRTRFDSTFPVRARPPSWVWLARSTSRADEPQGVRLTVDDPVTNSCDDLSPPSLFWDGPLSECARHPVNLLVGTGPERSGVSSRYEAQGLVQTHCRSIVLGDPKLD